MESGSHGPGGSAHAKKASVAVHRGGTFQRIHEALDDKRDMTLLVDTYQFAYFFRKNEPHAVLIKVSRPSVQSGYG